jgi:hypothetical protein
VRRSGRKWAGNSDNGLPLIETTMNLSKLFFNSNYPPQVIASKLEEIFPRVESEPVPERFFYMQFNCRDDSDRIRLRVRFGQTLQGRWMYEPAKGEKC